jgi:hypothetical protein
MENKEKNRREQQSSVIDISDQIKKRKKDFYLSRAKAWWYSQTSKTREYIVGGIVLAVLGGVALGPPIARKISTLKTEKQKISEEKKVVEDKYKTEKTSKENLERLAKRYENDVGILQKTEENYDETVYYSVIYPHGSESRLITAAIPTGKRVDDQKSNKKRCSLRYLVGEGMEDVSKVEWAAYMDDYDKNKKDVANDPKKNKYNYYIGQWINGEFVAQEKMKLKDGQIKHLNERFN